MTRIAIYPGSFDPITHGHLNIIARSAKLFDTVVVAIAENVEKKALFSVDERKDMIAKAIDAKNVEIDAFQGLLVDYAAKRGAHVIIRGLRAPSDFEFEFQMAHMNRRLSPELETMFMMTGDEHFYVSSRLVREVSTFGGKVTGLVPPHVEAALKEKFSP